MKCAKFCLIATGCLWLLSQSTVSFAGEADVVGVKAAKGKSGTWSFDVTVKHDDQDWDHYADRWEVLGPDGEILGVRTLLHPHVGEQPFTRGLDGVEIPGNIQKVVVRARDSVHGYGGKELVFVLPEK